MTEPVPPPAPSSAAPPPSSQQPAVPTPEKVVEHPSPLTGVARSGIALAAVIVILVREFVENRDTLGGMAVFAAIAAGAVALIGGISGVITWRTTTFVADDEEFRVEKNFINRSSSRVDYTKVQSIDIQQPFLARLLGLAKVHIDVGGAGGVDLAYLTKARAESLREHLMRRMQQATAVPGAPTDAAPEGQLSPPPLPEPEEELVVKVPTRNLILGTAVSTGTAWSLMVAVLFLIGSIVSRSPVTVIAGVLAVGGWIWSQTGKNWGFTMTRRGDTLRIRRGLLSTVTQGLRPHRIQAVAIRQDLLQRLTGLHQVSVTVLGYGDPTSDEDRATNAVVLPYGTWDEVMAVLHAIWPELDLSSVQTHLQPERARWLTPITFSTHTWGIGEDVVLAQHGLIRQVRAIVPHRRMQSASLEQGPIQRRLRLAAISIHTTDGPVSLKLANLDEHVAREVFFEQLERARLARLASE